MITNIFSRYKKREDSQLWNRKAVLNMCATDLQPLDAKVIVNKINIGQADGVGLDFTSNNYAEKDEIDLNATIVIKRSEETYDWVDLFHLIKSLQKTKYRRPLNIKKDEAWEGSDFQKQIKLIVKPVLSILFESYRNFRGGFGLSVRL